MSWNGIIIMAVAKILHNNTVKDNHQGCNNTDKPTYRGGSVQLFNRISAKCVYQPRLMVVLGSHPS